MWGSLLAGNLLLPPPLLLFPCALSNKIFKKEVKDGLFWGIRSEAQGCDVARVVLLSELPSARLRMGAAVPALMRVRANGAWAEPRAQLTQQMPVSDVLMESVWLQVAETQVIWFK